MPDTIAPLTSALAHIYRIKHKLGEGGMANVYLAEDVKHARQVAVKVLKPELAPPGSDEQTPSSCLSAA